MTKPIARRTILLGSGALMIGVGHASRMEAAAINVGCVPCDTELTALGLDLNRVRAGCSVLGAEKDRLACLADEICRDRGIARTLPDHRRNLAFDAVRAQIGYDRAWKAWSDTLARSIELAELTVETPASSVAGLAVKFDALLWSQFHDTMADSIDAIHLERLEAFSSELKQVAEISG